MTRPDVVVTIGTDTAILGGDRALDLVDLVGCPRPHLRRMDRPLDDLPRIRACALTRSWSIVENQPLASSP